MTHSSLPRPHSSPWPLQRSGEILAKAERLIPGTTLSMMKKPEHFAPGHFPVYLKSGRGAVVQDVDGNEYIDFVCGLGANSLGHQHPAMNDALQSRLSDGFLHSLPHELEVQVAESLIELVPGAEMARFFKTGADATSAAIRLARGITKRDAIVTVGYNGWHDHFMYDTPGVPQAVAELSTRLPLFIPPNEELVLSHVTEHGAKLAAVLLSAPYNRQLSTDFLKALRTACDEQGTLLIFDEIVTGFRLAHGGIQEFFGVSPDFSCYSKAIAGGMPLSAVVGPRKWLSEMEKLQVSTTFGGELLSLQAALTCMQVYKKEGVVEHITRLGKLFKEGINKIAEELESPLRVYGYDAIPMMIFDRDIPRHVEMMRPFQAQMAERGIILRRDLNFICAAHTQEQIEYTLDAARASLIALQGK